MKKMNDTKHNRRRWAKAAALCTATFIFSLFAQPAPAAHAAWTLSTGDANYTVGENAVVNLAGSDGIIKVTEDNGKVTISIAQGDSIALGDSTYAAQNSVALGHGVTTEEHSVALGHQVETGHYSVALGYRAFTDSYAVALGSQADANTKYSVALGYNSYAKQDYSVALGSCSIADEEYTVSVGGEKEDGNEFKRTISNVQYAEITENGDYAATTGQLYKTNDSISNLGTSVANAFGGDFNFENGALTGGFTYGDETTTIQGAFNSIRDELDKLSEGWTFNPVDNAQQSGGDDGAGTGEGATPLASSTIKPGDKLTVNAGNDINITQNGDKDYTISVDPNLREEIEEGYTAADSALRTEITEAYQQADSALKADIDKNSETIGEIGSVLGGAENGYKKPTFDTVTANDINVGKINISGSGINMGGADIATGGGNIDMGGGRITNVAGGAIAQGSTDAVNGGQLWDAYQRMDSMGNDIYRRMDDLGERINVVGAHAAALSGLHPIDYNPYEPTTLSAAVGTYRDEYAVAVGVFHYTRENVMFNLGASLCSDGDIMGRAGVSFTLGKSSKKQPLPPKDMNEVQAQLAQVQQALFELKAENKELREKLEAQR